MPSLLSGKTAVVTGGASGNGRGIARSYAEQGADVVVADVRAAPREGGTPTHERIEAETDRRAVFVECDVTDREAFEPVMDAAAALGGVDVMVNNAAVVGPDEPFVEVEPDALRRTFEVNVDGVFFGAQAAARRMLEAGTGGSIVNLSSGTGIRGAGRSPVYSATTGAVRVLTYALADALGPDGIRVNAIHPGFVETAMTTRDSPVVGTDLEERLVGAIPLRRVGQPADVAGVATFLASDLAGYVTAESIVVDGGLVNTA